MASAIDAAVHHRNARISSRLKKESGTGSKASRTT
jgi:hypothetical protein